MKNQIQQLLDDGQSVWLDNLRRNMFESGELKRLIDQGLRGMTSNPTIFEKAIGAGSDYDEQLGNAGRHPRRAPTRSSGTWQSKTFKARAMPSLRSMNRRAATTVS